MIVAMNKINKLPSFRLGKHFPAIAARTVTISFLILLMWALGRIAWIWVGTTPQVVPTSTSVQTKVANQEAYQLDDLLQQNFFGLHQNQSPPKAVQPVTADAPETRLNLTLVGVVASSEPKYALAVIGSASSQQVYAVGETIKNSRAKLRTVMPDRVVLSNNGRDEVLMLAGLKYSDRKASANVPAAKPVASTSVNSDQLASVKAEILKNPQNLLKYITLSQRRDEQGIIGYSIGPGSDNRLFNQSGLQTGDLVVSINGSDLRNPTEMAQIWQKLSDTSEINLIVLRNGQEHNVLIGL